MLSEHPVGFSSQGATLRGLLVRRTDSFTRAPVVVIGARDLSHHVCFWRKERPKSRSALRDFESVIHLYAQVADRTFQLRVAKQ
jgi:hypothetical protein